jgi:hypothetical protein
MCEYLLMSLHVPLESIETLAGKFGDEEARNMYPALQKWSHTREARKGLWHASQLISASTSLLPLQMRDFHAVAVYHASLAMWAYGMITGPAMWLQQQQQQYQSQTKHDGGFMLPLTPPQLMIRRALSFSDPQNTFLYLTDPGESPELFRWLSLGVGNPAIRLSSLSASSTLDSTNFPSLNSQRQHMAAFASEGSEDGESMASVQNPEAVMKLATRILLGRSVDSQTEVMDDRSPLVKNICILMKEIGAAARAVMDS